MAVVIPDDAFLAADVVAFSSLEANNHPVLAVDIVYVPARTMNADKITIACFIVMLFHLCEIAEQNCTSRLFGPHDLEKKEMEKEEKELEKEREKKYSRK